LTAKPSASFRRQGVNNHHQPTMHPARHTQRPPRAAASAVRLAVAASHVVMATAAFDDVTTSAGAGNEDEYLLHHPFADHTEGSWFDGIFDGGSLIDPEGAFASSTDFAGQVVHGLQLFNGSALCSSFIDGVTGDPFTCNVTSAVGDDAPPLSGNYWALILLVFPLLTVFGNVLVVMSVYRERSLQSVTNYFIVSLAIADIMVAILVMPLAVYVEVRGLKLQLWSYVFAVAAADEDPRHCGDCRETLRYF
jgi:hypothetical protein